MALTSAVGLNYSIAQSAFLPVIKTCDAGKYEKKERKKSIG